MVPSLPPRTLRISAGRSWMLVRRLDSVLWARSTCLAAKAIVALVLGLGLTAGGGGGGGVSVQVRLTT
jgi:hypothetical protein